MSKRKKSNGKVDRLASYINLTVAILNLILVLLLLLAFLPFYIVGKFLFSCQTELEGT